MNLWQSLLKVHDFLKRLLWVMIIKSIHVGEADLKHVVGCLIRLSEEKEFLKSLWLELFRDRLKLWTNRKLSYDLLLHKKIAIIDIIYKAIAWIYWVFQVWLTERVTASWLLPPSLLSPLSGGTFWKSQKNVNYQHSSQVPPLISLSQY